MSQHEVAGVVHLTPKGEPADHVLDPSCWCRPALATWCECTLPENDGPSPCYRCREWPGPYLRLFEGTVEDYFIVHQRGRESWTKQLRQWATRRFGPKRRGKQVPATSKKQQAFMRAELGRKRSGKKTRTGMSESQLHDFAAGAVKPKKKYNRRKPKY